MLKNLSIIVILATIISACNNDDGGGGKTKSMAGASSPIVDFPPPELSHKRTALVIGNSNYTNEIFSRLENPVNDAKDLAVVLTKLGFEVIELFNANRQEMNAAIRQFRDKLLINQGVGLFYFSGHGVDYNTKNHLIPLANQIKDSYDVDETSQTIAVDYVLREMQKAKNHINFLILDACRKARKIQVSSNHKGMKAIPDGLNVPNLVRGFLTAYAAAPGKVALSGDGERNSPYVKHLMRFIQEPNLSVEEMFKKVGAAVVNETNQQQEPGYYAQLYDPFVFNPQPVKEAKSVVVDNSQTDQRYQELVELIKNQSSKDSQKIAELQAQLAKLTEQLQQKSTTTPVVPTPVKKENTFVAGKVFQDPLKDGGFGPEMVMISGGTFKMGDIQGGGDSDEKPVHNVSIDKFAMGKFEVTNAEFVKFLNAVKRRGDNNEPWFETKAEDSDSHITGSVGNFKIETSYENHPMIEVSWYGATAYAKWLSDQTGKKYRLPTEAEWEYAARAGTTTKYWWGNDIGNNHAVCDGCGSKWDNKSTAPVGSFAANKFGLYDTSGNVWEWTCSEYTDKYTSKEKVCLDKNSNKNRVLRGGSWYNLPGYVRTASRSWDTPDGRVDYYGFRVVQAAAWTK
jgi:formylglycine-generating enzyme required for sulfatase activity